MLWFERRIEHRLGRAVVLIASTLLLSSCIVSYGVFEKPDFTVEPPSEQRGSLYYEVEPLALLEKSVKVEMDVPVSFRGGGAFMAQRPVFDPSVPTRQTYEPLRRAFAENQMFTETIPAQKPPAIGRFCAVDIATTPHSKEYFFAQHFQLGFAGLIPSYSGESGFIMKYDLYIDGNLKKTYQYEVKRRLWVWLGFLPFLWVNALTPSQGEAVGSTASQFFHDAHQDGFF